MSLTSQTEFAIDVPREVSHRWGWFVGLGVLFLILGLIAAANLLVATVASVLVVGALMVLSGAAQVVHAFRIKEWRGFLFWILSGLVYAVGGVLTFYNPILAASVMTLLIGAALVVAGVFKFVIGWRMRPGKGWGWLVAAAVVTTLTGILVMVGWPVTALWMLGLILAVDLTFQGISLVAFGLALRKL